MTPIPFDTQLLILLSVGQVGLLISALMGLAALKAQVKDLSRRISTIEEEMP